MKLTVIYSLRISIILVSQDVLINWSKLKYKFQSDLVVLILTNDEHSLIKKDYVSPRKEVKHFVLS